MTNNRKPKIAQIGAARVLLSRCSLKPTNHLCIIFFLFIFLIVAVFSVVVMQASFMYVMCGCLRHGDVDRALLHFRQASERGIGTYTREHLATFAHHFSRSCAVGRD